MRAHTYTLTVSHVSSLLSNFLARSSAGILPWVGFLKRKSMVSLDTGLSADKCRDSSRTRSMQVQMQVTQWTSPRFQLLKKTWSCMSGQQSCHCPSATQKTLSATFRHYLRFCALSLWPTVSWAENEPSASEASGGSSIRDEGLLQDHRLNSHQNERWGPKLLRSLGWHMCGADSQTAVSSFITAPL